MNISILHTVCKQSAEYLKEYLEANGHSVSITNPNKYERIPFRTDYIVSLGCSAVTEGFKRINSPVAVKQCVSKVLSFAAFNRAGVSTVEWTTEYNKIPKHWDQIVVRKKVDGRKAEDIEYHLRDDGMHLVPKNAALYTQCFYGRREYRIVVFRGKVVGRYHKHLDGETWEFNLKDGKGFEKMDDHCIRAAKALGIDYVGFDVLSKNKNDFVILEANSGATMTHEAALAICEFFNTLKG